MASLVREDPRRSALGVLGKYGTIFGLVAMAIGFSLARPAAFPTQTNLSNIVNQVALTAIIAAGLTLALIVGEFDLSIGYQSSFAGVLVVGLLVNQHLPLVLAIASALAIGCVVGLINGVIVTKLGVNALITTLGTGTLVVGVNYAYSGSIPIALGLRPEFLQISLGQTLGIPNPIIAMAIVLGLLWVVVNQTDLGQQMQAVGGNSEAARLSGIRVDRIKIIAFVLSGVCAAVTGVLLSSRLGSAQITAGDGYLLDAFAAAFLGSAALRDGEFHIVGTLIGVLTVGVGFNGLAIIGAPTYIQFFFKGALLIIAVALSTVARRYADR